MYFLMVTKLCKLEFWLMGLSFCERLGFPSLMFNVLDQINTSDEFA